MRKEKYITVKHVEDWNVKVLAKVIRETDSEIEVEYKYAGVWWGLTIQKNKEKDAVI